MKTILENHDDVRSALRLIWSSPVAFEVWVESICLGGDPLPSHPLNKFDNPVIIHELLDGVKALRKGEIVMQTVYSTVTWSVEGGYRKVNKKLSTSSCHPFIPANTRTGIQNFRSITHFRVLLMGTSRDQMMLGQGHISLTHLAGVDVGA